jgi:hypothetical protein
VRETGITGRESIREILGCIVVFGRELEDGKKPR